MSSLERLGEAGWLPDVRSEESIAGQACNQPVSKTLRAYSYYNRTGGNDDDERPINGHTAAHPAAASELCINGFVACGRKITWGPGLRACKGPLIRGRHGPTTARHPAR